jgi:protein SCO1/2
MDSRKYFIVSVAICAIAAGTWLSLEVMRPAPVLQTATLLPAATELAEFSLLDQQGNSFTRDGFKGRWNLVFFGFTHCPDVCPITLQVLANAQKLLAAEAQGDLPRIVLVSVDPERDTPEILGQYVSHFGDDTIGITGELDEVRKLTDGLGVFFEKSAGDDENYSVDHSAVVIVVNPDGKFHALFGAPHTAENFAHDLPILMSAN